MTLLTKLYDTDSSGPIGQNLSYLDSMNKLHWCKHASGINVVCKVGHKCYNYLLKYNLKELCNCRDGVLYIPGIPVIVKCLLMTLHLYVGTSH